MDSTDWPTALTPPSSSVVSGGRGVAGGEGGGGDVVITPQDNLESVLERVGLVEHQSLFKVVCRIQALGVYTSITYAPMWSAVQ